MVDDVVDVDAAADNDDDAGGDVLIIPISNIGLVSLFAGLLETTLSKLQPLVISIAMISSNLSSHVAVAIVATVAPPETVLLFGLGSVVVVVAVAAIAPPKLQAEMG